MKRFKFFFTLLVVAALLLLSSAACGKTDKKSDKNEGTAKTDKLTNPDITFIEWNGTGFSTESGPFKDTVKWFEKTYGGKVEIKKTVIQEYELKLMSMVGAGQSPDFSSMYYGQFPRLAIREIFQPVDKYIDMKNPLYDIYVMDQLKFKGEHYALAARGYSSVMRTWYNKTMFENNGVKTPLEYYNEGAWTFENFRKAAMELTQDTDKDGVIDQWGVSMAFPDSFVTHNGGSFVKYNDDGTITLSLSDPKTLEAYQFCQDGLTKDKWWDPSLSGWLTAFAQGKVAMEVDMDQFPDMYCLEMKDVLDFAPAPLGPGGIKDTYFGMLTGLSLVTGAKNPEGAVVFINKLFETEKEYREKKIPTRTDAKKYKYSEEQLARMELYDSTFKVVNPLYSIGSLDSIAYTMWMEITQGLPPTTAVEKYESQMQSVIDAAVSEVLPEPEAFTAPAPEDFESGAFGILTANSCTPASTEVTKDASEIIGGASSLKIVASDAGGFVLRTDETKVKLPSYHLYTVSFDYKVIKAPAAGGYFAVVGIPKANMADWAVFYGWNQMPELKDGDTGNYSCFVGMDKNTADNMIAMYNTGGGTIIIDNFKIEEK